MQKIKYPKEKLFYDNYKGSKATYSTFISRIRRGKLAYDVAIQPGILPITRDKTKQRWADKRNNEPYWNYYNSYEGVKPTYSYFKDKIKHGIPQEEAIKFGKKSKKIISSFRRKKLHKEVIEGLGNESYYLIEITFPKEEAVIFRNMYISKIKKNEELMIDADFDELEKLIKTNNQLIKELEVFNKWNPI